MVFVCFILSPAIDMASWPHRLISVEQSVRLTENIWLLVLQCIDMMPLESFRARSLTQLSANSYIFLSASRRRTPHTLNMCVCLYLYDVRWNEKRKNVTTYTHFPLNEKNYVLCTRMYICVFGRRSRCLRCKREQKSILKYTEIYICNTIFFPSEHVDSDTVHRRTAKKSKIIFSTFEAALGNVSIKFIVYANPFSLVIIIIIIITIVIIISVSFI